MAFEKGTPEYTFLEAFKKFEEETYLLDMLHKQNSARREFSQRTNRTNDNRHNLMETMELYDRIEKSAELQENVEGLFGNIDTQFEEHYQTLLKIGAARARINERVEIFNWLSIFIKEDATELIEERMTQKFGNEHVWKKEFSSDFLKKLHSYAKNPSPEAKEKLLRQISYLSTSNIRRSANDRNISTGDIDFSEMTFEETSEAYNKTRNSLDDLRLLEISIGNLYDTLTKIQKRVLH